MLRDGEFRKREVWETCLVRGLAPHLLANHTTAEAMAELTRRDKYFYRYSKGRGPWPEVWTQSRHWHWAYRLVDHVSEDEHGPDHVRAQLAGKLQDTPERIAAILEVVEKAYTCRCESEDEYQRTRAGHVQRFLSALWGVNVPTKRDPHHPEWKGDDDLPGLELDIDKDTLDRWAAKDQWREQGERQRRQRADAKLIKMARSALFRVIDGVDELEVFAERVSEERGAPITAVELVRQVAEGRSEINAIHALARLRREAADRGWLP